MDVVLAAEAEDLDTDPARARYVRAVPNAVLADNLLLMGYFMHAKWFAGSRDVPTRPSDVWLCGYPKSGNTWMSEILSLVMCDGDVDCVRAKAMKERIHHFHHDVPESEPDKWLDDLPSPRLFNTHLPITHAPEALSDPDCKIIYIVRNPKDVCVSYYHFHSMYPNLGGKEATACWQEFSRLFADGHLVYGDWYKHVEGYWRLYQKYPGNVLFLCYEELRADLERMLPIIGAFLGKKFTPNTLAKMVRHCSFEVMKDNNMANRAYLLADAPPGARFVRRGTIGDWRSKMSDSQRDMIDCTFGPRLAAIGLRLSDDLADAEERMKRDGGIISSDYVELN